MLKLPIGDDENLQTISAKLLLSNNSETVDGPSFIPIDCSGRSLNPSVSVNELGKQLLKVAAEGDIEETKSLLNKGALFTADWLGTSPLHLAAKNNHLEVVEILLKSGISRDARTKVDKTSLHMAATEGHVRVVETLLDYGADPDCRDLLGMTPLHWAVQNGHIEVVRVLMKHSAQVDPVNKFELTPAEIAAQINRQDIIDLLNSDIESEPDNDNPLQHLTLELVDNDEVMNDGPDSDSSIPLETILMEDESSIDPENLHLSKNTDQNRNFAESMRLLQEHGITMLPHDDNNILTTCMETGHSVVLTDAGKQVLNAIKESEEKANKTLKKKIITVTPEEFLSMTSNCSTNKNKNVLKQINGKLVPKNVKRIVMKKNKVIPVSNSNNVYNKAPMSDMETIMSQLIEARKTIEEYKIKLCKKEQEAERYKQQLRLLMENS